MAAASTGKKVLTSCVAIAMFMAWWVSPAFAQSDHPSAEMIKMVGTEYKKAQNRGGALLVAKLIGDCYAYHPQDKEILKSCMLWDLAASGVDGAMRQIFVGQGINNEPPSFFTKTAEDARLNFYGPYLFGDEDTAKQYFYGRGNTVYAVQQYLLH